MNRSATKASPEDNSTSVTKTETASKVLAANLHQDFEPLTINPFVKESLNVGSDIINIQALQETYPHLAVLDPVTYS